MAAQPQRRDPKDIEELTGQQPEADERPAQQFRQPTLDLIKGGGKGGGPESDLAAVPKQNLPKTAGGAAAPKPDRPLRSIQGGRKEPPGRPADAPPLSVVPDENKDRPVDVAAVDQPLPEATENPIESATDDFDQPQEDDEDRRPDLRDLDRDEDENPEENDAEEGPETKGEVPSEDTEAGEVAEEAEAAEGAEAAGAAEGAAMAAEEAVTEEAASVAARAGIAALMSNPVSIGIIVAVLAVLFLVIIFAVIIPGMGGSGAAGSTSTSSENSTGSLDTSGGGSAEELLNMKNVTIYPGGRDDLKTGQIDKQVINLLIAIGKQHKITVTSLKSGHSQYTSSGNVSDHYSGHAVDIFMVDRKPCLNAGNPTRGVSACSQLAADILKAEKKKDPQIIYTSFKSTTPRGLNCVRDAAGGVCGDHRDHIHIGYPAK